MAVDLKEYIATIPDYPIKGVLFRDVTPILQNGEAFKESVDQLAAIAKEMGADVIIGPESRGFVFGAALAYELGIGFVPVRKPGKLPRETISCKYSLEYGTNEIFMHKDSVNPGQRVLIIDDLLATGGTAKATTTMVEQLGGVVAGLAFIIELEGLPGRKYLEGYDVRALLTLPDSE
ncbi:MAG: adenine phosphoribosyltransferase [Solobacterium sp.]|nr:adenine phosphoribosyltransferase [Solobacterium sp.]